MLKIAFKNHLEASKNTSSNIVLKQVKRKGSGLKSKKFNRDETAHSRQYLHMYF